MGNHAFQIALQRHLLDQCPAAVGIPLQAEWPSIASAFPLQPLRGMDPDRTLEREAPFSRLKHRRHDRVDAAVPVTDSQTVRKRCSLGCPDLPVVRMGHQGCDPDLPPAFRHPFCGLETGEWTGDATRQRQR